MDEVKAQIAAKRKIKKQQAQEEKRPHIRPRVRRHLKRSYREKRPPSIKTLDLVSRRRHFQNEEWIRSGVQSIVPYKMLENGRMVENESKIINFVERGYVSRHECIGPAAGRSPLDMLSDRDIDFAIQLCTLF